MKKIKVQQFIGLLFIIILLLVGEAFSSFMIGKSFRNIFLGIILNLIFGLILIYLWSYSDFTEESKEFKWYVVALSFGVVFTCFFPWLPVDAWFVLPLALALGLTSSLVSAVISYTGLLGLTFYIADANLTSFFIYLFAGIIVQILFNKIDKNVKIGLPCTLSVLVYSIALFGKVIFYSQKELVFDAFLVPILNIFLCLILMLGVLRVFCAKVVDKEKGQYIDINDQEFPLLAKYKEEDPDIYYNAIHTAYFSEKIARLRGMDIDLAKNGGYYHKIIANECNKEGKTLEEICAQYKFPPSAVKLLQEYNYKSQTIRMKETAIVYLSDAVISSILFLQNKDDEHKEIDYGQVAKALINRKKDTGILNDSDLSFKDLVELEKVFIGEKLYYDFLRRERN